MLHMATKADHSPEQSWKKEGFHGIQHSFSGEKERWSQVRQPAVQHSIDRQGENQKMDNYFTLFKRITRLNV